MEELRLNLVRAIVECPHGEATEDCILNDLRGIKSSAASNVIKYLTPEDVQSLYNRHMTCYKTREGE
jgi:hypothetical protein